MSEIDEDRGAATEPDEARLEQVGEQIEAAARRADENLGEPGRKYHESGDAPSRGLDDQTIVPPG